MKNHEQIDKERLERAKQELNKHQNECNALAIQAIYDIFPELKESEDDVIRKEIIQSIQDNMCVIHKDKCIAWLEKQGEQKPSDKVEPKFKVGDWIVNNDKRIAVPTQILEIEKYGYVTSRGYTSFDKVKTDYHLWTIQDVEDGDVLYHKSPLTGIEYIVMSRGVNGCCNIDSYFRYNSEDGFDISVPSVLSTKLDSITPATKEQCDLLFQKMEESGYQWDAEKKELKNIEQKSADKVKPKFASGDYIRYRGENYKIKDIEDTKDGFIYNVSIIGKPSDPEEVKTAIGFTAEQDIVKIEHPTWSEDDENHVKSMLSTIECCKVRFPNSPAVVEAYNADAEWLKSLKDRVQPQTKQEWSKDDEEFISILIERINQLYVVSEKLCKYEDRDRLNPKHKDWLIEKIKSLKPQPKQEWNEEDEKMLESCIDKMSMTAPNLWEKEIDWLKSLKDRVRPQTKQEWSKEDEEMIDAIVADILFTQKAHNHEVNQVIFGKEIDWLKSLNPQKHWKPSEEQLEALWDVIPHLPNCEEDVDKITELSTLYDELKKTLNHE